jgi:Zn-dependent protease/predicted transcriptional regulator
MTGHGFRLGKIAGFAIRVDWSWLLIVTIITWNLTRVFSRIHPEWELAIQWGISSIAAILFFTSVLAHEIAHSLVARAYGLPVQDITLFLFGGVAKIEREPQTPKVEFLMAIAGPLTSLLIGVILTGLSLGPFWRNDWGGLSTRMSQLSPVLTIFLWLGSVNIILAVFNMIPGFPLDGGRVLRSIFWLLTNNLRRATHWASIIGRLNAGLMILTGVAMILGMDIPILGRGLINGVWLAFIGWFLHNASAQSYQTVAMQDALRSVLVAQIMRKNPPTVDPGETVLNMMHAQQMESYDQALPVLEENALVGIVTLADVHRVPEDRWGQTTVSEIMTPQSNVETISPEEYASDAMEKLVAKDVLQLPVVRSNCEFVGLLRRRDLMRWLQIYMGQAGGQNY